MRQTLVSVIIQHIRSEKLIKREKGVQQRKSAIRRTILESGVRKT